MTIDKAIEILSNDAYRGMATFNEDFKKAEKLGIEALKFIGKLRKYPKTISSYASINSLLEDETEDT